MLNKLSKAKNLHMYDSIYIKCSKMQSVVAGGLEHKEAWEGGITKRHEEMRVIECLSF